MDSGGAPVKSALPVAKTRPKREPLNRERIAVAALELVDQEGLANLSTRKLGARLGVEGMAIYRHYPSMEALLDAVAEKLILEVRVPGKQPGGWKARLRQFARDYRQLAWRHPKAYLLLASRRFNTPASLGVLDQIFGAMIEEGFTPLQAVEVFRSVGNYCSGVCLDELAGMAYAERDDAALPPGAVSLQKCAKYLGPDHFEVLFDTGLDALIDGLDRRLER